MTASMMDRDIACVLARPFGQFQHADAQGDVRHDFANAVIEYHERLRGSAYDMALLLAQVVVMTDCDGVARVSTGEPCISPEFDNLTARIARLLKGLEP